MTQTLYHLKKKSANRKTGPIPVSTSSAATCPTSCPLTRACYAKHGPLAIHWRRVSSGDRGKTFGAFLDDIRSLPVGQFWRHNEAGDLPGQGDQLDIKKLEALVDANKGKSGFTYTHKPHRNRQFIGNPDYHASTDTPDKVDIDLITRSARLSLALLLDLDRESRIEGSIWNPTSG